MTLSTTRQQMIQAIFSGVAFSLRHILDCIQDLGLPARTLIASGGAGVLAGDAWPTLRGNIYNRPLFQPPTADSTSLGTLILTLVALGIDPDAITSAARVIPELILHVVPNPARSVAIERRYMLYRDIAAGATPLFDQWLP